MFVSEKTSPWVYLVFHFTDVTIQLFAFEQYFGVHELNLYIFFLWAELHYRYLSEEKPKEKININETTCSFSLPV